MTTTTEWRHRVAPRIASSSVKVLVNTSTKSWSKPQIRHHSTIISRRHRSPRPTPNYTALCLSSLRRVQLGALFSISTSSGGSKSTYPRSFGENTTTRRKKSSTWRWTKCGKTERKVSLCWRIRIKGRARWSWSRLCRSRGSWRRMRISKRPCSTWAAIMSFHCHRKKFRNHEKRPTQPNQSLRWI